MRDIAETRSNDMIGSPVVVLKRIAMAIGSDYDGIEAKLSELMGKPVVRVQGDAEYRLSGIRKALCVGEAESVIEAAAHLKVGA